MSPLRSLGITLAVIAVLVVILLFAPPTLLRVKDPSAVDPGDGLLVVLNPARDRSAERVASHVLGELRSGRCEAALAFVGRERQSDLCERERKYRVRTWSLRDRKDVSSTTHLFFAVFRGHSSLPSNTWITLKRDRTGWRAVDFECWY